MFKCPTAWNEETIILILILEPLIKLKIPMITSSDAELEKSVVPVDSPSGKVTSHSHLPNGHLIKQVICQLNHH